jgi:hypothetical protein
MGTWHHVNEENQEILRKIVCKKGEHCHQLGEIPTDCSDVVAIHGPAKAIRRDVGTVATYCEGGIRICISFPSKSTNRPTMRPSFGF